MPVDAVSAHSGPAMYATPQVTKSGQEMNGDMFLTLLVTQLQNQDPSSPMDTGDMISQTTQLAMMERLTSLDSTGTENFSLQMRTSAAALIGSEVTYLDGDGKTLTGTATSVSFAGPVPMVTVDGSTIALDAISGVTTPTTPTE